MDTRNYNILSPDEVEVFKKHKPYETKWLKEIPDELLPTLQGMNRKERREYYRKNKRLFKKR